MRAALALPSRDTSDTVTIVRTALAVTLAWLAARVLLEVESPSFAPLTALFVTQRTLFATFGLGLQQVIGVALGVTLGGVLLVTVGFGPLTVFLAVLLGLFLARLLPFGGTGTSQIPVSAMLVVALSGPGAADFVVSRIAEAAVGGLVGAVTVAVLAARVRYDGAEAALEAWAASVVAGLRELARFMQARERASATPAALETVLARQRGRRDHATSEVYVLFDAARSHLAGRGVDVGRLERVSAAYARLQVVDAQVVQLARVVPERMAGTAMLPLPVDPAEVGSLVDALGRVLERRQAGRDVVDESRLLKRRLELMAEDVARSTRRGTMGGLLDGIGILGVLEQIRREVVDEVAPTETDLLNWSTAQIQVLRDLG